NGDTGDLFGADAGDRIHAEEDVPQNVTHPYVQIRRFMPGDNRTINQTIVLNRPVFIVTGVAVGNNLEALEAIQAAIHADLHGQSGSATRGDVFACALVPNGWHILSYRDGETRYVEMGGRYRVWTE